MYTIENIILKICILNSSKNDQFFKSFKVCSYNILTQKQITPNLYSYVEDIFRDWNYRKRLLLKTIYSLDSNIICLQEVSKIFIFINY